MARRHRETIAPNTYRDAYGIDTIVTFRGEEKKERWSLDADPDELARWVQRAKSELMDRAADAGTMRVSTKGTLIEDATAFVETRAGRPSAAADASHLKAWTARYGTRRRHQIKPADIERAIATWRRAKVAPQTIIHRCRVLRVLWRHFDGAKARTPIDTAAIPKRPQPHPVRLPAGTLHTVAAKLKASKAMKVYGRFAVLATTLQRPIQMVRAKPADVDLTRRTWFVRSAKNEPAHVVYLNDEQLEAWRAFIAADCWGTYNDHWYRARLRKAGWPEGVSTYNYRHEGVFDALEAGADLGDVQGLLGHTEIETTRRNYGPLIMSRQRAISDKLGRRLARGTDGRGTDGYPDRRTFLAFFVVSPARPIRAFLREPDEKRPVFSDLAMRA